MRLTPEEQKDEGLKGRIKRQVEQQSPGLLEGNLQKPGFVDLAEKGLSAGVSEAEGIGGGLLAFAGGAAQKLTGGLVGQELEKYGMDVARRNFAEAERIGQSIVPEGARTFKEVRESDDPVENFAKFATFQVAKLLPMVAVSGISGGSGGVIAGATAKQGLKTAVNVAGRRAASGATSRAIDKAAIDAMRKRITKGATAGAAASSIGMETGSIYQDIKERTGKSDPFTALKYGVPAGLLDVAPEFRVIKSLVPGGKKLGKNFVKEGFKQAGFEGATEAGQTVMEEAAAQDAMGRNLTSPEALRKIFNKDQLLESAVVGALGGGVLGGGTALAQQVQKDGKSEGKDWTAQNPVTGELVNFASQEEAAKYVQDKWNLPVDDVTVFSRSEDQRDASKNQEATKIYGNVRQEEETAQDVPEQKSGKGIYEAGSKKEVGLESIEDLGFFSPVKKVVRELKQEKGSGHQFLRMLEKQPGVKKEELEDLGLSEWLKEKGKVTKQEIEDFVEKGGIQLEETKLSKDIDSEIVDSIVDELVGERVDEFRSAFEYTNGREPTADEVTDYENSLDYNAITDDAISIAEPSEVTKFEKLQMEGPKENYTELLLTSPSKPLTKLPEQFKTTELDGTYYVTDRFNVPIAKAETKEEAEAKALKLVSDNQPQYYGDHFDEGNIIAHARTNVREIEGKPTLFVEEIQSDLHQEGRKEGYRGQKVDTKEWKAIPESGNKDSPTRIYEVKDKQGNLLNKIRATTPEVAIENTRKKKEQDILNSGVPNVPFKKSWPDLMMKRLIAYAQEKEMDQIAWTPGKVQAARYKLSNQVSSIDVQKVSEGEHFNMFINTKEGSDIVLTVDKDGKVVRTSNDQFENNSIDEIIGKELSKEILQDQKSLPKGEQKSYKGKDLEVGGKKLKNFYDRDLVNKMKNLLKKYGGKLEVKQVQTEEGQTEDVWFFKIPEKLKKKGSIPLYSEQKGQVPISRTRVARGIEKVFGKEGTKELESQGAFKILSVEKFAETFGVDPTEVQGIFSSKDGTIYLHEGTKNPEAVVLHEGTHAKLEDVVKEQGLELLLGDSYWTFQDQFEQLLASGDPIARLAQERANKGLRTHLKNGVSQEKLAQIIAQERLAYYAEESYKRQKDAPLFKRILAKIRAWISTSWFGQKLAESGIVPKLDDALIVELARMSLRETAALKETYKELTQQIEEAKTKGVNLKSENFQAGIGFNKARIATLLGQQMYGKMDTMSAVATKEVYQNSFDAIKDALDAGLIEKGQIDVTFDEENRTITVQDNGIGMTPEIIQNAFLTVAGSEKKSSRASGGFGYAKMLFLLGADQIKLVTVHNGQKSILETTGEQLIKSIEDPSQAPTIQVTNVDEPNGTVLRIKIPETYTDPTTGEVEKIKFKDYWNLPTNVLEHSPLFENIDVTLDGKTLPVGANFNQQDFIPFATVKFEWGTADIIVSKKEKNVLGDNLTVLSHGLEQFSSALTENPFDFSSNKIPREIYVNIKPKVSTTHPSYPFAGNRQGMAPAVEEDFNDIFNYLSVLYKGSQAKEISEGFGKITPLLGGGKIGETITLAPESKELDAPIELNIDSRNQMEVKEGKIWINGKEVPKLTKKEIQNVSFDLSEYKIPQDLIDPSVPLLHNNTQITLKVEDQLQKELNKLDVERTTVINHYANTLDKLQNESLSSVKKDRLSSKAEELKRTSDDLRKRITEVTERIEKQRTSIDLIKHLQEKFGKEKTTRIFTKFGKIFKELRDAAAKAKDETGLRRWTHLADVPVGVSLDQTYKGVFTKLPFTGMFINPAIPKYKDPKRAASGIVTTIIHEIAHFNQMNHNASYVDEFQDLLIVLDDSTDIDLLKVKTNLAFFLEKNKDFFSYLYEVFENGNVENFGASFQDGGYERRTRSNAGNRTGNAAAGLARQRRTVKGGTQERIGNAQEGTGTTTNDQENATSQAGTENINLETRAQEDTPQFKQWFQNSKVVDKQGRPKVVYHGTVAEEDFDTFDPGALFYDERTGLPRSLSGADPTTFMGAHFAEEKEVADLFARGLYGERDMSKGENGRIIPAYLAITNPLVMTESELHNMLGTQQLQHDLVNIVLERDAADKGIPIEQIYQQYAEDPGYMKLINERAMQDQSEGAEVAKEAADKLRETLRKEGYDGIKYKNEAEGGISWIAFDPEQIKSAIGNSGDFSNDKVSFMESFLDYNDSHPEPVKSSLYDRAIYEVQDKLRYLYKKQKELGDVPPDQDAYTAETRYHGKVYHQIEKFHQITRDPMLEKIAETGLGLEEIDQWLLARHAGEANARLRRINAKRFLNEAKKDIDNEQRLRINREMKYIKAKEDNPLDVSQGYLDLLKRELGGMPEKWQKAWADFAKKPSGMTDEQAQKVLAERRGTKGLEEIGRRFDQMNRDALFTRMRAGLLTQEEGQAILSAYKHWAPLRRKGFEDSFGKKGKGFSLGKGEYGLRAGSGREVADVLANAIAAAETSIIRAEKQKIGQALLNLVKANPDKSFWRISSKYAQAEKPVPRLDPDGSISMYPNLQERDNEIIVKVDGVPYKIIFEPTNENAWRIAHALKNLDNSSGAFINGLSWINRWLSMVNTSLSPEFLVNNFFKDIQTAQFNLNGTEAEQLRGQVMKGLPGAFGGMKTMLEGNVTDDWSRWAEDFASHGGMTGWLENYKSISDVKTKLEKTVDLMRPDSSWSAMKRGGKSLMDVVQKYNNAVENAVRLSTYKAIVESQLHDGMTEKERENVRNKAATVAKELTVNFNRKGASGQALNALYLFANAGIQGNMRLLRAIRYSPKARAMVVSTIGAAALLSAANRGLGGDDDDGVPYYDKIPNWIKERNMIFMIPNSGGKYIKIPLPWGYNVFWVLGDQLARAGSGDKNFGVNDAMASTGMALLGAFSPMQGGTLAQMISPTITDPGIQILENKTFTGAALKPENSPFAKVPVPEHQLYWSTSRPISRWAAKELSDLTGGDEIVGGRIDWSPEWLDLVWDSIGGSAARFVGDSGALIHGLKEGNVPETKQIPFVRRIIGQTNNSVDKQMFYERRKEVWIAEERWKKERKKTEPLKLLQFTKMLDKRLKQLRKLEKSARTEERKDQIKVRQEKLMAKFNKKWNDVVLRGRQKRK